MEGYLPFTVKVCILKSDDQSDEEMWLTEIGASHVALSSGSVSHGLLSVLALPEGWTMEPDVEYENTYVIVDDDGSYRAEYYLPDQQLDILDGY